METKIFQTFSAFDSDHATHFETIKIVGTHFREEGGGGWLKTSEFGKPPKKCE